MNRHSKPSSERAYETKRRLCLMCRKPFASLWPGQRICRDCKQRSAWRDGETWLSGPSGNDL